MASSSTPKEEDKKLKPVYGIEDEAIVEKSKQLYKLCSEKPDGAIFYQDDLLHFNVAAGLDMLLTIIARLMADQLFQVFTWDKSTVYAIRKQDIAEKLSKLKEIEHRVFLHVEGAGTSGLWTKALKAKTNFTQPQINKAIQKLEGQNLIKQIYSVKNAARKSYILAWLKPAEDIAGTPFHNNGELDTALIESLSELLVLHVQSSSWRKVHGVREESIRRKKEQVLAARRARNGGEPNIKVKVAPLEPSRKEKVFMEVPHPQSYSEYPTMHDLLAWINGTKTFDIQLREIDMQNLLDMLVYDGQLEKVKGNRYRTTRQFDMEDEMSGPGNGWSDAPCSRCPVFSLCEEGSVVNAAECAYFDEWLLT